MKFETSDLLEYVGRYPVVITTNGTVKRDGKANLGRGNAKQVGGMYADLAEKLGRMISESGNHVHLIDGGLISYPVEDTWTSYADIRLVERSAKELKDLADSMGFDRIYMPLPGCGGGGLRPSDVISAIAPILDDRFIVLSRDGEIPAVL